MVSLPLLWFLLSIDFNRYVGTCLSTECTSDATFRLSHADNVVPAPVILGRIGQDILGTEGDTQPAALASLSINYYGSLWHVCILSESMSNVCRRSSVAPNGESAPSWMIDCLWHFVSVLCPAIEVPVTRTPLNLVVEAESQWRFRPECCPSEATFGHGLGLGYRSAVHRAAGLCLGSSTCSCRAVLLAFRILSSASLIATA